MNGTGSKPAPDVSQKPAGKPAGIHILNLENAPSTSEDQSDKYALRSIHSEKFIQKIQDERHRGYGFVPFIGAGFSAPSGAPIVHELQWYLQRCIFASVTDEVDARWHPRTDQWPPLIGHWPPFKKHEDDPEAVQDRNYWAWKTFGELMPYMTNKEDRASDKEVSVRAQAIGSSAEWRTALLYLSRLKHGRRGTGDLIGLEAPLQEIIDSGLRAVLKGKDPTLEQNMLGVLAGALRLDLILTTNFDNLLERAFHAARNPLQVFEVHLGDSLPHWTAVSEVRALVKMHGNRHSLRADYSLDVLPTEIDKQRFLEYLLSGSGRRDLAERIKSGSGEKLDFQNHLLIMGCGATEPRTQAFIEYAWKHLSDDFKVYWICYSARDVENIQEFTERSMGTEGWSGKDRCVVLRHANLGLLLLEMYQTIRRNLPPFGGLFPSVSRVTLPPLPSIYSAEKQKDKKAASSFVKSVVDRLVGFTAKEAQVATKLLVLSSPPEGHGLTTECSTIFRRMEERGDQVCLWFDMNDISSANNLFEVLLEAAYFKLGVENWIPVYRERDEAKRTDEIERLARSVNKHWVIFLNARERPGANTADHLRYKDDAGQHGWLADISPRTEAVADDSSASEPFLRLIGQLCGAKSPRISVVLMCREPLPVQLQAFLARYHLTTNHLSLQTSAGVDFSETEIVANAIRWTSAGRDENENRSRRKMLHALILMQRPRLLATIWSNAASEIDEALDIAEKKQGWLAELEEIGLLRRKAGGFIWIHLRCRQLMREILEGTEKLSKGDSDAGPALALWNPKESEARIHKQLAKWYEKVLDASESPAALFEALYHFYKAAYEYCRKLNNLDELSRRRTLDDAQHTLESAASLLRANSFLVQTQGYARGSCRRLAYIRSLSRKFAREYPELEEPCLKLQRVCTEVMRAIAREVGENSKAYLRHWQLAQCFLKTSQEKLLEEGQPEAGLSDQIAAMLRRKSEKPEEQADGGETYAHSGASAAGQARLNQSACALMRWYRWSGMLAMGSRSYEKAESAFERAEGRKSAPQWFADAVAHEPESQELLIERLRVAEQYIELLLQQFSLKDRLARFVTPEIDPALETVRERSNLLDEIDRRIKEAHKLVYKVRSRDSSSSSHDTMSANLSESRLLTHQSVYVSLRSSLMKRTSEEKSMKERSGNKAMALLDDAEASLRISDSRRNRAELGIIELHRAEGRLIAADAVEILPQEFPGLTFGAMCKQLRNVYLKAPFWETHASVARFFQKNVKGLGDVRIKPEMHEGIRRAGSLVNDGMHYLDRAEPVLRERRRNVWWTTWFFEKRLRMIGMAIWSSLSEVGVPIPYLGLEFAARGSRSLADDLLENGKRMSGVDAYRMATIVDAYASCAKALRFRTMLEPMLRLSFRQEEMAHHLNLAVGALEEVSSNRDDGFPPKHRMSSDIRRYIETVGAEAKAICRELDETR